mmetsp:Transcript_39644/g.60707  ORF Transcript_39644/g.60707 Transcript_39644/m.60707 type:complete len:119 (-) Transcript_39644:28-384(-)
MAHNSHFGGSQRDNIWGRSLGNSTYGEPKMSQTAGRAFDQTQAMNELYNKRQQAYNTIYTSQNQDLYQQRHKYNREMASFQKKQNEGEQGKVPWGTGFQRKNMTTNSEIGGFYRGGYK